MTEKYKDVLFQCMDLLENAVKEVKMTGKELIEKATRQEESDCQYSKYNITYPIPGYCLPAPRQCEKCTKFKSINKQKELIDLIEDALRWFPSGVWDSRNYIDRTDIENWLSGRLKQDK